MSRREVWFAGDVARLQEILADGQSDLAQDLGIGFFSARRRPAPEPGISLRICPHFLRESFLSAVGRGFVSPLSHEILFLGQEGPLRTLPIRRWLMVGLQSTRLLEGDGVEPLFREWPELLHAQSGAEIVTALLAGIHRKVLELRAGRVVFSAALSWILELIEAVAKVRDIDASTCDLELVRREFMAWVAEELLHPNLIVLPENSEDFIEFVTNSKPAFLDSSGKAVLKL